MSKRHVIDIEAWVWDYWCNVLNVTNPASQLREILHEQTAINMVEQAKAQMKAEEKKFDAGTIFDVSKATKCNECNNEVPKGSQAIIFRNRNGDKHIVHIECRV